MYSAAAGAEDSAGPDPDLDAKTSMNAIRHRPVPIKTLFWPSISCNLIPPHVLSLCYDLLVTGYTDSVALGLQLSHVLTILQYIRAVSCL
jgi:hypothetical protein